MMNITIAIQPAVKQGPGYDLTKDFTGVDGSEPMLMSSDEFNEFLRRELLQMNKFVAELGLPKQ